MLNPGALWVRSLTGASVRNERRAWSDERARMAEKLRSNYQLAGQTREIRPRARRPSQ